MTHSLRANSIVESMLAWVSGGTDARRKVSHKLNPLDDSFSSLFLHEIRNPLSAIRMTVDNLQQELHGSSDEIGQQLERLQKAAESIDYILQRISAVDQMNHGALTFERLLIYVGQWLTAQCNDHPSSARLVRIGPASLMAAVDEHLLMLMVANLVDNAVKYSKPSSSIVCHLQHLGSRWRLTVSNEVGTVSYPDPEQLFVKYYCAPEAKQRGGLGLGLYWVRGVARLMGGDVTYQQQYNRVVFNLWLPL